MTALRTREAPLRARADEWAVDHCLLLRLWSFPRRRGNAGVREAFGADEPHRALAALRLFPCLDITVTPLTRHPSDLPRVARHRQIGVRIRENSAEASASGRNGG
jgi:muconolactone delta-isomerase